MNKKALVTGASRGIGKNIARELAANHYDLYLTCLRSEDKLLEMADTLSSTYGVQVNAYQCDMSSYQDVAALFQDIKTLDVLINNAGISHVGLLQDMSLEEWQKVIGTNLSSVFYTCKHAIPLMLQKHGGQIINISSVWGNVGASMEVAYSASKGGINSFTKALAKELAPSSISVNALACGAVDTDMNRFLSEEEREMLINEIPFGRMASAAEAAEMVSAMLSMPLYTTGQIFTMDGGWQ